MEGNFLSASGAETLVNACSRDSVAMISLHLGAIVSAPPPCESCREGRGLKELWLGYNSLGPTGAMAVSAIFPIGCRLELLDLEGNNIGDDGATCLAEHCLVLALSASRR